MLRRRVCRPAADFFDRDGKGCGASAAGRRQHAAAPSRNRRSALLGYLRHFGGDDASRIHRFAVPVCVGGVRRARTARALGLEIEPQPGRTLVVRRHGEAWTAEEHLAPRLRLLARAVGTIQGGLLPANCADPFRTVFGNRAAGEDRFRNSADFFGQVLQSANTGNFQAATATFAAGIGIRSSGLVHIGHAAIASVATFARACCAA